MRNPAVDPESRSTSRPRTLIAGVALAVGGALALVGCGGGDSGAATGGGDRVPDPVIQYAHQQEPPCVFGGWIEQAYLSYNVLDNLLSLDDEGKAVPWLAEKWSVSDDNLTWTFELKPGVTFTDGTPVDAEAVAYNFDYWMKGGNSTALVWLDGYYESAKAVDATTLQVTLSRPYPRLPETVTQGYFGIQSKQALETRTAEENCEQPIGSGAFTVGTWNRGQDITLLRNDAYTSWPANAKHQGPAYAKEIRYRFVPDPTTRASALRAGEVSAIYDVAAADWAPLGGEGFQELKYVTKGRPLQLSFNTTRAPFDDAKVRQAFAYSLDREKAVETIGQGLVPYEGNGPISQSTAGYSQAAADLYAYDPDKANALLDEAGWTGRDGDGYRTKGGKTLEVVFPYGAGSLINKDGASIIQTFQDQAKATGFKVELIPVTQAQLFAGAYGKPTERDIQIGYWTAVTAGILYINWRPSTPDHPNIWNDAFYNDEALEKIILRGNSALDIDEQNAAYAEAQDYIAERALSIGVYARLSTFAVSPKLKDFWQENAQGGPVFHDAYLVQ